MKVRYVMVVMSCLLLLQAYLAEAMRIPSYIHCASMPYLSRPSSVSHINRDKLV